MKDMLRKSQFLTLEVAGGQDPDDSQVEFVFQLLSKHIINCWTQLIYGRRLNEALESR